MKVTSIVFLLFLMQNSLFGQKQASHISTTLCGNSRYEIIQSDIAARGTYKVDKFAGYVWQMTKPSKGRVYWNPISYERQPLIQISYESGTEVREELRFQLFSSGFTMSQTFIIDVKTGETWKLYSDSETEELFFGKIQTEF